MFCWNTWFVETHVLLEHMFCLVLIMVCCLGHVTARTPQLGNTMSVNVLERLLIVRPNLCFEHKKIINTCFVVGGDLIAIGPWTGPCPWLHVSFSLTRARCHAMYCNHYSTWRPCLWRVVLQAGPYQTWHPDTQPMEMPSIELFLDNHAFQRIAYPGPCHKHIVLFWKQQIIQMVLHTKSYTHNFRRHNYKIDLTIVCTV